MNCAVCQQSDGLVINIIVADVDDISPDGCVLIQVPEEAQCNLGWYWNGNTFTNPYPDESES